MLLALDISTKTIGWVTLGDGALIGYGFISPKGEDIHSRLSFARIALKPIIANVDIVVVEKSLRGFAAGKSSAITMEVLTCFNFGVRDWLVTRRGLDVESMEARTARRLLGVSQTRGTSAREKKEAVRLVVAQLLPGIVWPVTRRGTIAPEAYDIADAACVGLAWLARPRILP